MLNFVSVHRAPHLLCCLPAGRAGRALEVQGVCVPSASHLQHAYSSVDYGKTAGL
jgi:hypothetical protein